MRLLPSASRLISFAAVSCLFSCWCLEGLSSLKVTRMKRHMKVDGQNARKRFDNNNKDENFSPNANNVNNNVSSSQKFREGLFLLVQNCRFLLYTSDFPTRLSQTLCNLYYTDKVANHEISNRLSREWKQRCPVVLNKKNWELSN